MANTTSCTQSIVTGSTRTPRRKPYTKFYHRGIQVTNTIQSNNANLTCLLQICLNTFLFLHGIGKRRYDAVRTYYLSNGIEERIHGNTNHLPHNGLSTDELRSIVSFLQNYAEENAILLPGRIPGYKRTDLQLLPTSTTKRQVWEYYIQSCATLTFRVTSYCHFCLLWRKYVPHIIITTPRTDLCWTCQQNSFNITASSNKTEDKKSRVQMAKLKWQLVIICDYYRHWLWPRNTSVWHRRRELITNNNVKTAKQN